MDTNAVSALLAGDDALASLLATESRHHLPVVVLGEYRFGLLRSNLREKLESLLETLVAESFVLQIDEETSRIYAAVRGELRVSGRPIPENDVWIAALARQHDQPVVSRDRHFDSVPRLVRLDW